MPVVDSGIGRLCTLESATPVKTIIARIKTHLKLESIRFAQGRPELVAANEKLVKTVAICAGSGGSVLKGVKAGMYFTGEMSHHDILDGVSNGVHIVLGEHSNTAVPYTHLPLPTKRRV